MRTTKTLAIAIATIMATAGFLVFATTPNAAHAQTATSSNTNNNIAVQSNSGDNNCASAIGSTTNCSISQSISQGACQQAGAAASTFDEASVSQSQSGNECS